MPTKQIREAIDSFSQELLGLIRASVAADLRATLGEKKRTPAARPGPVQAPPRAPETWPIAGTNCFTLLELLRARSEGMTTAEVIEATGLGRAQVGKALAKLRVRGDVRGEGGRGNEGMRYFAQR